MASLVEVIQSVKEENLTRDSLERYYEMVTLLISQLYLEIGTAKKQRAVFMGGKLPEESVAARKIEWEKSEEGQKLIDRENQVLSAKSLAASLKSRIYAQL